LIDHVARRRMSFHQKLFGALHDDAPAGLVATAAVAGFTALWGRSGLDDGGDGGSDGARHVGSGDGGWPIRSQCRSRKC
jgi:hypothetical protein